MTLVLEYIMITLSKHEFEIVFSFYFVKVKNNTNELRIN